MTENTPKFKVGDTVYFKGLSSENYSKVLKIENNQYTLSLKYFKRATFSEDFMNQYFVKMTRLERILWGEVTND